MNVKRLIRIFLGMSLLLALGTAAIPQSPPVMKLAITDQKDGCRIILTSSVPLNYAIRKAQHLVSISIPSELAFKIQQEAFKSEIVNSVAWTQNGNTYLFSIEIFAEEFDIAPSARKEPFRLTVDIKPVAPRKTPPLQPSPQPKMTPPGNGEPARVSENLPVIKEPEREFRNFRSIVIDPGHGGIETGAKGKFGALEKDVTLAIALKLRAIIEKNMGYRVFLTRDTDLVVPLENRSALANNHKADLFISIHANGSFRKNARGSETFFLNLNATDEESRRLAYMENSSRGYEGKIEPENQDDVKLILWDLAQSSYLKQSSRLAEIVQAQLNSLLGTANRGIKQAPFRVLTGVACPAILVEAAFISNPEEEKELQSEEFQNNVAEAIFKGLGEYLKLYP